MAAVESCGCSNCYCCTELPPPLERSVKRRLDAIETEVNSDFDGDTDPDRVFDVLPRVEIGDECAALREALEKQKQIIQDLYAELDEERDASSTAANETMSMIVRLQREKAELEMEARQFKVFAEEKMAHDQEELLALEEVFARRDEAIQELSREIKVFRRSLAGCGVDPETVLKDSGLEPSCNPSVMCDVLGYVEDGDEYDFHRYGSGEVGDSCCDEGCLCLKHVEEHVCELEKGVIVGKLAPCENECDVDGKGGEEFPDVMDHNRPDDGGDDIDDRVYTVDAIHEPEPVESTRLQQEVTSPTAEMKSVRSTSADEAEIKKLYMRLQALEADRESLKETIVSMRADTTQLELLKAIAQNLSKGSPQPDLDEHQRPAKQPSLSDRWNSMFKWISLSRLWKKKAHPCRYSFGLTNNNPGLLLLVTGPGSSNSEQWPCQLKRFG